MHGAARGGHLGGLPELQPRQVVEPAHAGVGPHGLGAGADDGVQGPGPPVGQEPGSRRGEQLHGQLVVARADGVVDRPGELPVLGEPRRGAAVRHGERLGVRAAHLRDEVAPQEGVDAVPTSGGAEPHDEHVVAVQVLEQVRGRRVLREGDGQLGVSCSGTAQDRSSRCSRSPSRARTSAVR